jgi:predicted transglutaminase-like cysteine proteinase
MAKTGGKEMFSITRTAFAAVIGLVLILASATAPAQAAASGRAPLGFRLMCIKMPNECKGGGAHKVTATEDVMATLKKVNARVNSSIRPRNDKGADVWTVNASAGDCEDYVMTKRRALIKAGIPASSLRIAYVKTRSGVGHAILIVKTSKGDFVLDNLNRAVRPLSQSGYRIVSMSGANPKQWS